MYLHYNKYLFLKSLIIYWHIINEIKKIYNSINIKTNLYISTEILGCVTPTRYSDIHIHALWNLVFSNLVRLPCKLLFYPSMFCKLQQKVPLLKIHFRPCLIYHRIATTTLLCVNHGIAIWSQWCSCAIIIYLYNCLFIPL